MPGEPEVVELTGLPKCEPSISETSLIIARGGSFLAYDAKGPDWPRLDSVALVQLVGLRYIVADGPNDEAFHRHRFYPLGLRHYTLQEVLRSPWIAEVGALLHKDGLVSEGGIGRHLVLAFKETSVDAVASQVVLHGQYATHEEAIRAACEEVLR